MRRLVASLGVLGLLTLSACSSDDPPGGGGGQGGGVAEIISFAASAAAIDAGDELILSWKTQGAVALELIAEPGGELSLEGLDVEEDSLTLTPAQTATYTLRAVAEGGAAETATVEVEIRQGIVASLTATPERIAVGEEATLRWEVEGAETVSLFAADGSVVVEGDERLAGEVAVSPALTTTYTLTATRGALEATAEATVEVEPRIDGLVAEVDGPVVLGAEVPVRWSTAGAAQVSLSTPEGVSMEVEPEGNAAVEIGASGQVILTATSGSLEATETLTLVLLDAPTISSFVADPVLVTSGLEEAALVELAWSIDGAETLRLEASPGGELELSEAEWELGAAVVPVEVETVFTLHASNAAGAVSSDVVVRVVPLPTIQSFDAPPLVRVNSPFELSWEVEDASWVELRKGSEVLLEGDPAALPSRLEQRIFEETEFQLFAYNEAGAMVEASQTSDIAQQAVVRVSKTPDVWDESPVTLSWETENAVSVAVYRLDEDQTLIEPPLFPVTIDPLVVASGSIEVEPTPPATRYLVQARNAVGDPAQASVEVETLPVELEYFTLNPEDHDVEGLLWGDEVPLRWKTKRARDVWLQPASFASSLPFVDLRESAGHRELVFPDGTCGVTREPTAFDACEALSFPDGFTFPFGGERRGEAKIFARGVLSFDTSLEGRPLPPSTTGLPEEGSEGAHLIPFWWDMLPTDTVNIGSIPPQDPRARILYELLMDPIRGRHLIVQWEVQFRGLGDEGVTTDLNYQLVMWEDGGLDYRYGTMRSESRSRTSSGDGVGMITLTASSIGRSLVGAQVPGRDAPEVSLLRLGRGIDPILARDGFELWLGGLPPTGERSFRLMMTGDYHLFASDGHTVKSAQLNFDVTQRAKVVSVKPLVEPARPNERIVFSVVMENAERFEIRNEEGVVVCATGLLCRDNGREAGVREFTVSAFGPGENNVDTIILLVPAWAAPKIDAFWIDDNAVVAGGKTNVRWITGGATSFSLLVGEDEVEIPEAAWARGSWEVEATEPTTIKLVIGNPNGETAEDSLDLKIRTVTVDSFTASKESLLPGQTADLSWSTTGAGTVSMTPLDFRPVVSTFVDVSAAGAGGTKLELSGSGVPFAILDLNEAGFTFPFFGAQQSSIQVTGNGWLSFGTPEDRSGPSDRLGIGAFGDRHLAPFWDELHATANSGVYWKRVQDIAGDQLIIQWKNYQFKQTPQPDTGAETDELNFQVVLFADGAVEYRYGDMWSGWDGDRANGSHASIALQNTEASLGAELSFRRMVLGGLSDKSWRFVPAATTGTTVEVQPTQTTTYRVCIEDADHRECMEQTVHVLGVGDLMITEVQPAASDPGSQWFEIRNLSKVAIDLVGMTIRTDGGTHTIASGNPLLVQPGAYFTLAASASPTGFTPGYSYADGGSTLVLAESDELSLLYGSPGAVVARARWDDTWLPEQGESLALDSSRHIWGKLSDANKERWCVSTTEYTAGRRGTPGQASVGCLNAVHALDASCGKPFIDIASTGTVVGALNAKNQVWTLPPEGEFGFKVSVFGTDLRPTALSSNGYVSFGALGTNAATTPRKIPTVSGGIFGGPPPPTNGYIAAYWGLLEPQDGSRFIYEEREVNGVGVMIFQWDGMKRALTGPAAGSSGRVVFQAQLWENGEVVLVNETLEGGAGYLSDGLVLGFEAPRGAQGIQYEGPVHQGQALCFSKK